MESVPEGVDNNNSCWGFMSQNDDMIMRDAIVEGSGNFDQPESSIPPPSKCGRD